MQMLLTDPAFWTDQLRRALERYDESLLREVAGRLLKPRNRWPAAELIERCAAVIDNVAVIDRLLRGLEPSGRRLLALIGHSRQPRWKLGSLVELLITLESSADVRPVLALFETGLLFPELPERVTRFKHFEQWLGLGAAGGPEVFAHPCVLARALGEDLGLPKCPGATTGAKGGHEADGLEWPLRLCAAWQQVAAGPLRRTTQGDFFKRDLDRLHDDALLSGAPADALADLPDPGLLTVELALLEGLIEETKGELTAVPKPPTWEQGLPAVLASLWALLPRLDAWNAHAGWTGRPATGNPHASAQMLALLLLARLPRDGWADPAAVEEWVAERHPFWRESKTHPVLSPEMRGGEKTLGRTSSPAKAPKETTTNTPCVPRPALARFLLGIAYQLRMVEAARDDRGAHVVRLSATGRWLLGMAETPAAQTTYPQTLLVQPNLEIVVYRQGLTPALIARLSQFAAWKSFGSACTLQLQPETVYRALEAGQTFETIRQTLEQHGMRPTPVAVIESLRTWSNKRERLGVYPAATLFEFASADDLNEALGRGLPGTRLSDRLALVLDESAVDFRHFRLTGTRDYGLPPEKCVVVEADGVTLNIDMTRSDLLLETELERFAESAPGLNVNGRRQYRLTPASLAAGRDSGFGMYALEGWFLQRTGQPLTPAARLLLTGSLMQAPTFKTQLVLHVATPELADGLLQWPQTRALIQSRLGPTALAVAEENVEQLREKLGVLGVTIE